MPLETILGVPAPPRHFAKPLHRWLFFLASRYSVVYMGIILGLLLALPYVYYADAQREAFLQRLREEPLAVKYLSQKMMQRGTNKGSPKYTVYEYEIELVRATGDTIKQKYSSEERLGCLRYPATDIDDNKIGCSNVDKLLYSGAPEHRFFTEKPKMRPTNSLYAIVPAFFISLVFIGIGISKQRQKLTLLLTGLVAEGSWTTEEVDAKNLKGHKSKKVLRRYEFSAFDGNKYQVLEQLHSPKRKGELDQLPILYALSNPNEAMIYHAAAKDWYIPKINADGSIEGFSKPVWGLIAGMAAASFIFSVYLVETWGALPK